MINTNGKRIARDDRFLEQLNDVRPAIYFQFDGFDSETYRILRGEPNILERSCVHWIGLLRSACPSPLFPRNRTGRERA